MGFCFRRRIKLLPGIRLNISKSGLSTSVGEPGATINLRGDHVRTTVGVSDTVRAERTHYFDVGLSHSFTPQWTVGVDAYYKRIKNLLDEGQFGQALILTPFNYAEGRAQGVEFSSTYSSNTWSGYLNLAISKAKGKNIVSGQSLFAQDELDYITDHFVYLDHDQRYSISGGVTYRFGASRVSGDFIYGSGLRNTPDGARRIRASWRITRRPISPTFTTSGK